jgi:MFS family permease
MTVPRPPGRGAPRDPEEPVPDPHPSTGRPGRILPREPWRRNQLAVTVAAAMVFLAFTLVMPFLPFYVESLGVRDPAAVALWSGLLLTVSPLLAAILGPFWGRLADRVGMRIMVQRVLFTIALHWGLMYFAANVWHLLALRIMLGLFSGFGTMSVALVTHGCPRDRIGHAVGVLQATQILSTALGPFVGGVLAQSIGVRSTFLVTFGLCATALIFVRALYRDTPAAADEPPVVVVPQEGPVSAGVRAVLPGARPDPAGAAGPPQGGWPFRRILGLPLFLPLLPLLFFVNLVDRSLFLSVPLYVRSLVPGQAVEAMVGMLMSGGALAGAGSAWYFGRRAGRVPPARLLLGSLACSALLILPMAFCRAFAPFAVLRLLLGLSIGGAATLAYTLAGDRIPAVVRATGYGILSSVAMLGGAAGPILSGLLSARDLRAPFLMGGIVYLALTLHLWLLARRGAARTAGARAAADRA